jgi:hypothetical protein
VNDDQPTPDEFAAQAGRIGNDQAIALRWLSSLNDANHGGVAAAMTDTVRSGRGIEVTTALMFMTMDLGRALFGVDGFQKWLDQQTGTALDVRKQQDDSGGDAAGT